MAYAVVTHGLWGALGSIGLLLLFGVTLALLVTHPFRAEWQRRGLTVFVTMAALLIVTAITRLSHI
jgi:hypothetical protein